MGINSAATTASITATTTMPLSSLQRSDSINEDDAIDDIEQHNDIIGNDDDGTEDNSDMGEEQSNNSSDNNSEQIDETNDSMPHEEERQDDNNEKKKDLLQNIKENYIIEHQPEIESTFTIINPDDDRNEDKFQDVHVMSMNETFITSSNQEVRTRKRSKKDKVLKWMNKKFYT